ncbi:Uncharacterised protein [Mycobacterium tuberculosis]|uniref:Uncharacterized protein n=2 Tax=Mycobacterium tuberculosis TaxID=1773 RepID=A0A0T7PFH1_MYCTX|nr:Uncharacterised protein [Mycobacterium tuberculosis]CFR79683.1 Uncharacterised protein [Mycobacterium tuberculosis]CKN27536.1 Uncharacterised protein [Mycobacterium tuberculosis]CKP30948.1 Uncharacterised protein [Mycobacterium tuberculosis]CKR09028.1 Uncharacterised protein [Mycobacterium tuberculosis]
MEHTAISSSSAPTSPDTTTAEGPLTTAMLTRSPKGANKSRAWSAPHAMDTMPPGPASPASNLLRSVTTRAASRSDSAPAT